MYTQWNRQLSLLLRPAATCALGVFLAAACAPAADTAPPAPPQPTPEETAKADEEQELSAVIAQAAAESEQEEADKNAVSENGVPKGSVPIADVHAEVDKTASEVLGMEYVRSPGLIRMWPNPGGARMFFIAYPLKPNNGSETNFKVGFPIQITVDLTTMKTTVRKLDKRGTLKGWKKKTISERLEHDITVGEQTLVNLLLETRTVEDDAEQLAGYEAWFDAHPDITKDIERHSADGVHWLQNPE